MEISKELIIELRKEYIIDKDLKQILRCDNNKEEAQEILDKIKNEIILKGLSELIEELKKNKKYQ